MGSPTSRLLELLELLQARPVVTGREIAERLGVDARTVRRYLTVLQELGIPVEGQRGVGGGYRMRPGYRLPPLMLGDDEAVVVVLGLLAARRPGLDTSSAAAERALEKIHRVLPVELRRRVEALERTLGFTGGPTSGAPVPGETVLLLADAVRRGRRVRSTYRSYAGEPSRRELSPFGLVVHAGRWYLAAYDHGRSDLRTFRIDRMSRVSVGTRTRSLRPRLRRSAPCPCPSPRAVDLEVAVVLDLAPSGRPSACPHLADLSPPTAGRCFACGSSPSTDCEPLAGLAVGSRSALRTSSARACATSAPGSPPLRVAPSDPDRVRQRPRCFW